MSGYFYEISAPLAGDPTTSYLDLGLAGAVIKNQGPEVVYYRATSPFVTSSLNDGSIAPGASVELLGSYYFAVMSRRAQVFVLPNVPVAQSVAVAIPFATVQPGGDVQAALNTAMYVMLAPGVHTSPTATQWQGKFHGQTLVAAPGVTIIAGGSSAPIQTTGFNDWSFLGNYCTIDLNETANIAVRIRGVSGSPIRRATIEKVQVTGRALPPAFNAALYIAWCDEPRMADNVVRNYGISMTGSANVSYCHYFENCTFGVMIRPVTENSRVAIEFWECFDSVVDGGHSRNCTDNGVYCTGNVGARNRFVNCTIDACEEGIVIFNDDCIVVNSYLLNNTNSGVTARGRARGKILNCVFIGNSQGHIIDDNGLADATRPNDGWEIAGNTFLDLSADATGDAASYFLFRRWYRASIHDNVFTRTRGTGPMITLSGTVATPNAGDQMEIYANQFDNPGNTIPGATGMIRLNVGSSLVNGTEIRDNTVWNGDTLVRANSAAGTPGTGTVVRRITVRGTLTSIVTRNTGTIPIVYEALDTTPLP